MRKFSVLMAVIVVVLILSFPPPALRSLFSTGSLSADTRLPQPPSLVPFTGLVIYPGSSQALALNCSNKCIISVCTWWVPGPSPQCPKPGSGGGCCLQYTNKCDPSCKSDQPPSITGTVTCDLAGSNGWCRSNAQLQLSASDPQGYSVTISGNLNGTPFSCGPSCTLNLPIGTGTASYTATSSTSNLTASGSSTWKYDPNPPTASLNVTSGTLGTGGWYTTSVTEATSSADAISGVATVSMSDNGGAPVTGSSIALTTDGAHDISATVTDNAGNMTTVSSSVTIDTTPPAITFTPLGTTGNNGWYVSPVKISITAMDVTSGIQSPGLGVSVDGGTVTYNTSGFNGSFDDGVHSILASATDIAGNNTSQTLNLKIDTIPPTLSISVNPSSPDGANGWYKSPVGLSATASDGGSSLATIEYRVDGGPWTTGANLTVSNDGVHMVDFRATDKAGNTVTSSWSGKIDQTPPSITLDPAGTHGNGSWYTSNVSLAITCTDPTSGVATLEYNLDNVGWQPVLGPISISDGMHTVQARSTDNAGNQFSTSGAINVDTVPPTQVLVLNGTQGANGWYISNVQASINASDSTSGVGSSTISDISDSGSPAQAGPITLTEGGHNLQYVTTDGAGNTTTATATIKVDTTAPVSQFTAPASSILEIGAFQITGSSSDSTSNLSSAQLSFDNSNWTALGLASGSWSYDWDPSLLPNGNSIIYARATDQAGNVEPPIQLSVMLDNHPPRISLTSSWLIWNSGSLTVTPDVYALKRVSIFIKDPLHRWPNQPVPIALSKSLPTTSGVSATIKWDRYFGTISAPSGSYIVLVKSCDVNNVCNEVDGKITIPPAIINILPFFPTPTLAPTMTPTMLPTIAPTPTGTLVAPLATPTRGEIFVLPTSALPTTVPIPTSFQPTDGFSSGSVQVGGWATVILLALAFASLMDPRPSAIRRLTASIGKAIEGNKKSKRS